MYVEIDKELAKELKSIQSSMNKWSELPVTMSIVIKTIIQWYYLAIGYPVSSWDSPVKEDIDEIMEMKYFLEHRKFPTKRELNRYIKGINGKK